VDVTVHRQAGHFAESRGPDVGNVEDIFLKLRTGAVAVVALSEDVAGCGDGSSRGTGGRQRSEEIQDKNASTHGLQTIGDDDGADGYLFPLTKKGEFLARPWHDFKLDAHL